MSVLSGWHQLLASEGPAQPGKQYVPSQTIETCLVIVEETAKAKGNSS